MYYKDLDASKVTKSVCASLVFRRKVLLYRRFQLFCSNFYIDRAVIDITYVLGIICSLSILTNIFYFIAAYYLSD